MKKSLLFLMVVIFFVTAACRSQKTGWKGRIEKVDGITVVKNPKEPIYDEVVFSLNEELSIGKAEGEEEYMFSGIEDIDVSPIAWRYKPVTCLGKLSG